MQTKLIKSFDYNGLTFFGVKKCKPIDVEIIGVNIPCDPGIVVIKIKDEIRQVPTFALEDCPKIDFGKLLTEEQVESRQNCGFLFGSGSHEKPYLLRLEDCPLQEPGQ